MPSYFVYLTDLFSSDIIPDELFKLTDPQSVLDKIGITEYRLETTPGGLFFSTKCSVLGADGNESVQLVIPQFPDLGFLFKTVSHLDAWFEENARCRLSMGEFSLRLPKTLLQPVKISENGTWAVDGTREFVEVAFDFGAGKGSSAVDSGEYLFEFTLYRSGQVEIDHALDGNGSQPRLPNASLNGPAMIAGTGVVINISGFSVNMDPDDPSVGVSKASLLLPPYLGDFSSLPEITIDNALLTRRGFSGTVSADFSLEYNQNRGCFCYKIPRMVDGAPVTDSSGNPAFDTMDGDLFGLFNGGLNHISVQIEQNQLTAFNIIGAMVIPYFDQPVDIRLNIQPDGSFTVTLLNLEPNKPLTKEELLELYLESLQAEKDTDGNVALIVSGGLQPMLQSSDGMGWPRLDVKDLRIDSTGKFSIKEAWLDLTEHKPLDLYGFTLGLDRIGLGVEPGAQPVDDKMWIDLSGSLRLLPQIPVGLGVEGFRLLWPMDLGPLFEAHADDPAALALEISKRVEVQFKGIQIFFGVPDAIEFEGLIRFFKSAQAAGFSGDVALPRAGDRLWCRSRAAGGDDLPAPDLSVPVCGSGGRSSRRHPARAVGLGAQRRARDVRHQCPSRPDRRPELVLRLVQTRSSRCSPRHEVDQRTECPGFWRGINHHHRRRLREGHARLAGAFTARSGVDDRGARPAAERSRSRRAPAARPGDFRWECPDSTVQCRGPGRAD